MRGSGSVFRIRIQEAPEYGFNTNPDPQHGRMDYESKMDEESELENNTDRIGQRHILVS